MSDVPVVASNPMNVLPGTNLLATDQKWPTDNMFLNGPFAPWSDESEAYDLPVIGNLPEDLVGALFRMSSNPRFQPRSFERYHWFEGDGMVAAIYLRDGKAAFRTSWVRTDSFKVEVEAGEAIYRGFVNGGSQGHLPVGAPEYKNYASTHVGMFDDHLLVYYENGLPHALNPETLETLGEWDFHSGIDIACTAHFKHDPATGDMLFFSAVGNVVTWYVADARTGQVKDTHSFTVDIPVFLHDFAVTENYAAFFVTPTQFRKDYLDVGRPGVVWDPAALPGGTYVALMDRRTHEVTRYETGSNGLPTHFYNAYEIGDEVVIHCHRGETMGTPVDRLNDPVGAAEFFAPSFSWEFRANTRTGTISDHMISDLSGDLPRINDLYTGRQNRYGYFTTMKELARHDYVSGSTQLICGPQPLTVPSEPVFVPRASRSSEDDGYLLSVWWDPITGLSDLLVHEASTPDEQPIAQVKLPARVPVGFHGNWADQAVIEASVAALGKRS